MNVTFTDALQSEMREHIEKSYMFTSTPRCPPGGATSMPRCPPEGATSMPRSPLGGATYSLDEVGTAEEDDDDDNDDDEHSGDDRRSRCKQQDPPGACRQCVCATGINGGGDGVSADHVGCLGCLLAWGVCLNVVRTDVWSVAQDLFRLHLVASTPSPCFSTPVAEFRLVFLYDYRQEYEY